MSNEIKNKFICLVNCLSAKSRSAKSRKDGDRQDDYGPIGMRMEHTRRWLQSLDANHDDFPSASVSLDDSEECAKKEISKSNSNEKHNSLSNAESEIDLSDDRTLPRLQTVAQVHVPLPPALHNSMRDVQSVPSANSIDEDSFNSSCFSLSTEKVFIRNDPCTGIGISIVGHRNGAEGDCGIFVGKVKKKGLAAATGKVEPGDLIVEVNGISLENRNNDEAIAILRRELSKPGMLTLVLAKFWDLEGYSTSGTNTPRVYRSAAKCSTRHYTNEDARRRVDEISIVRSSQIGETPRNSFRHPNMMGTPMTYYVSYPNMMVYAPVMPMHYPRDLGILLPPEGSENDGLLTGYQILSQIQSMPSMAAINVARDYAQRLLDTGHITGTERRFHDGGLYAWRDFNKNVISV